MSKIIAAIAFILSLIAITLICRLESRLVSGDLILNDLRFRISGSVYKTDELEPLGMNKHFITYKEDR